MKYVHDCKQCVPCGHFAIDGHRYDLYYCANREAPTLSSLIARWGDDGPDYASSHPPEAFHKDFVPQEWEKVLVTRARELGVYVEPAKAIVIPNGTYHISRDGYSERALCIVKDGWAESEGVEADHKLWCCYFASDLAREGLIFEKV